MLRRQDILKAVGTRGQKRLGFFGNMGGMIIQDDSDSAFRGIPRVEVAQQTDELNTAVAILDPRRDVAVLEVQRSQYRACAKPLVLMVAADLRMLTGYRGQVGRRIADGLHAGLFIHRNGDDSGGGLTS